MSLLDAEAATQRIAAEIRRLPAETLAPADALGRVLATPVVAVEGLPGFDNSAMDGFALAGDDPSPLAAGREFDVAGEAAAGDARADALAGRACSIMTGAPLPRGLDRVVPVEQVEVLARDAAGRPARIRLGAPVPRDQHVRHAGEDVAAGATVLDAGSVVEPQQLMLLAALGVATVEVAARPRVALLCTGRELVDDPAQPLASGQIRNSNGPFLAARLTAAGADVVRRATIGDEVEPFLAELQAARAAGCRVVISTGAVSMGQYDFVPQALARLEARIVFHKLAIRPGKPLLFAVLGDGALFFGLPGNPASSAVGLRFFVEPALRAMLGVAPERPLMLPLAAGVEKKPGLRLYAKARVAIEPDGRARVEVLPGQESFRILPLAQANAWAVLPAEAAALAAGTLVEVYPPGHLSPFGALA
jgi:molybdopterin molybdotransferase